MREPNHPPMGRLDRRIQEPLEEEDAVYRSRLDAKLREEWAQKS
jgi:hypothetical protein